MTKTADRIAKVEAAIEAGFLSNAAKKRANEDLSRAFDAIRRAVMDAILSNRGPYSDEPTEAQAALTELYFSMPDGLHQVRDRHFVDFAAYPEFEQTRDLMNFRQMVKDAEIVSKPVDAKAEKIEAVRKSIIEQMEARKASYVEGLDMSRMFGLQVSVTAHWVHGHKGATFLRHFFYLRGRLTALNVIIAIADTLERETSGK